MIQMTSDSNQPHLKRVLGRFDLVLLFVVAVFNLNVVPSIAANGGVTVWLWLISLLLFFWPQGIAVIELRLALLGEGAVIFGAKKFLAIFTVFFPDGVTGRITCSMCRRLCCTSSACRYSQWGRGTHNWRTIRLSRCSRRSRCSRF